MLLNLSNHPSLNWSKQQHEAAVTQYGDIEDIAFPHILPEATSEEVLDLAKAYAEQIASFLAMTEKSLAMTEKSLARASAVHLMGEMTFVCALVQLLQQKGIVVVCSTTERVVLAEKDGQKTAQFRFVQFRAYPIISSLLSDGEV